MWAGAPKDDEERPRGESATTETAEVALRRTEALLRAVLEKSSDAISLTGPDGKTRYLTASVARVLGWTPEEMRTRTPRDQVLPEDRQRVADELERMTRIGQRDMVLEFRARHRDGSIRWIAWSGTNLLDDPDVRAIVGNYRDITARKEAEEEARETSGRLRVSEERYRRIVETTSEGVWVSDASFVTTFVNEPMAKMLGYARDEMLGQPIARFITEAGRATADAKFERRRQGFSETYENAYRRKDGTTCWALAKTNALFDESGAFAGTVGLLTDMSERRALEDARRRQEEQSRQSQKMETVGRLAGGVAHDFNNLLSVILSYADIAIEDLRPTDPMRDDMIQIQNAARRASELTRQLLAFSRQQVLQPRVIDLNDVVSSMDQMLHRLLGEEIELQFTAASTVGRVIADPGQIEQVLMNLAVNARDAMPTGGKLTIEVADAELDAAYASAHANVQPGPYVMLAVSDTGTGMDAPTCARIFEPFFTTKEVGKGTGLGLATVFGIVQQSGGHIGVYTEPGAGTAFKIYLPRTDRVLEMARPSQGPVVLGGTETILLVEDEEQVRNVACAILRRHGYRVLETSNGEQAMQVSRDLPTRIHLLLTDVVMPRMGGRKLAEALGPVRPGMKVLFASGYTDDAIVHHGVLEAGVEFLQKPFTPDALLRKVREVLDRTEASVARGPV